MRLDDLMIIKQNMFPDSPTEKLHTIADAIHKLSDFYIKNPTFETPWNQKFCQILAAEALPRLSRIELA